MKNLWFILVCLVVLGGCKKDETVADKLEGTWRFVGGAQFDYGKIVDTLILKTDCEKESFIKFSDNGIYRCRDVCNSEYTFEGRYELQKDQKTMKVSKNWLVIWPNRLFTMSSVKIVTLTENKLVMEMIGGHSEGSWCEYRRE